MDDVDQHLERLRLLASALGGRTLDVAAAQPGARSWTDGGTIYLEPAPPGDQLRMLAVQASLVAAGSLAPEVLGQLLHRPRLAIRYLAVEGHRALAANEDVLPPLARSVLDRDAAAGLAGADASLAVARSRQQIADPPAAFGSIDVRRALVGMERIATSASAADGTEGIAPLDPGRRLADLDDEDTADAAELGSLMSSPVGGGGPVGRLLSRLFAPARSPGGAGPPGADAPTHGTPSGLHHGARTASTSSGPGHLEGGDTVAGRGTTYPEWDRKRSRYRSDWCTVHESDAPMTSSAMATLADTRSLRRPLARLGSGLAPSGRRPQGDDIDIDAAVEARLDRLAGSPHDEGCYIESLRRRRDLSVLILIDVSGSAGEPGSDGRTVHEHQQEVARALTIVLHQLGDRVALFAFNSHGRRAVQFLRIKGFDDHLDGTVARRLDGLVPGAYTRLGAAIRHGTAVVEAHGGSPRRMLVVLSDGFAYDHGYEGAYGESDPRRALTEARRRGVGCVCLSVGNDGDTAALRRVFGSAAYTMVPTPAQLPLLVGPQFRAALGAADAQRRAFQRKVRRTERLWIERRHDDHRGPAVLPADR